jgi:predicted secreted protein
MSTDAGDPPLADVPSSPSQPMHSKVTMTTTMWEVMVFIIISLWQKNVYMVSA